MNKEVIVKTAFAVLVTLAMSVVSSLEAFAYTEEDEKEAAAGADAANPTAVVNFQDIRYRYFDLKDRAEANSFETEGAYMFHPRLKFTNELRGINTDRSGEWETNPQELKLKGILLTDGKPLGIKARYQSQVCPRIGVDKGSWQFKERYRQWSRHHRTVSRHWLDTD